MKEKILKILLNNTKNYTIEKLQKVRTILIIVGIVFVITLDLACILIGIVLIIIGVLFNMCITYRKKEIEHNNKKIEEEKKQEEIKKAEEKKKEKYNNSFHIAGMSYHEKELNQIINGHLEKQDLTKYNGMTDKEIIDSGDSLSIYEEQYLTGVKFEKYKYEGKDAIKVLLDDDNDNLLEVGNVPKKEISNLIDYIDNDNYIIECEFEIVGGNTKDIEYDDAKEKDIVVIKELEYGIVLYVKIKEK